MKPKMGNIKRVMAGAFYLSVLSVGTAMAVSVAGGVVYVADGIVTNQYNVLGYGVETPTNLPPQSLKEKPLTKPYNRDCTWAHGEWKWWRNGSDSRWEWFPGYWKQEGK
jgi:hypothetical protein